MVVSRFVRHSLFVFLCLSVIAAGMFVQASAAAEFEPRVGQEGKDVIWVPTPQVLVDNMLDMAKMTAQDFVIDLGSGDGRTVITAAKRGARAMGIEYDTNMVALSKRNAAKEGVSDRTEFVKADLFESDFSRATVITMFLLQELNLRLRPRLLDMKPGTRVVSNAFTMGEWTADEIVSLERNQDCSYYCTAYLWIVPAKVEGTWTLPEGELALTQTFQTFSGTLKSGSKSFSVLDGKLVGDQIRFSVGETLYSGKVSGGTMQGTFTSGVRSAPWNATRSK
ncbi:MAG: SAM-dependent methyltransferase [Deltaproteobacteria bacterium]|nr:SAM-dependent methyltransferase [Deltaproteobacteria bacterium]